MVADYDCRLAGNMRRLFVKAMLFTFFLLYPSLSSKVLR
jgi:hypothetical protein